jgi:photosystem II stability/assembly factor-like uncharacterized protein
MGWRERFVAGVVASTAALMAASIPASAAVLSGHSGWSWGNPLPQGNDINAIEFAGNRGYAAGKFGTLLRTDDGGTTWTGIATGLTQDLGRVWIIDSDSLVVAGGCALRRSDDAGESFTRLPWTASDLNCPSPIASLAFPTDQIGYLLIANGTVFRTADGGRTWSLKTAVPGTPATGGSAGQPSDLFFTGPDTGVVVVGGHIYRTTDQGGSWTLVKTQGAPLKGLFFVDGNSGYAVGSGTLVLETTDGGINWTERFPRGNLPLRSVRCANKSTCLFTVETGDRLLRTTNNGNSLDSVTPSTDKIFAASFASSTRAVAAGAVGTTVVSDNAGATWSAVGGRLAGTFTRLRATSSALAFAPGAGGMVARTTDGGNTWGTLGVSTPGNVVDTSFPNQNIGYALDTEGSVLKTQNGGASWQILNTGTTTDPPAILAPDPGRVLLIGPRGVRISTDGGGTFSRAREKVVRKAILDDADRAGSAIFAWSFEALIVSTNGGKSWKRVRRPSRSGLVSVDFIGGRVGFALTLDGRVWSTRNRGRRWRELPGIGTNKAIDLAFSSPRNGYALTNELGGIKAGYALRTSDGGKTWRPQLVDDDLLVERDGLAVTGDNTAVLLTQRSALFTTATGGDMGAPSTLKLTTKRRKLRRKGTILVTGKLTPAEGGDRVVVSMRGARLRKWRSQRVTVASNGTFTTTWKVNGDSIFVAQWPGDDDRAGHGSGLVRVRVRRR